MKSDCISSGDAEHRSSISGIRFLVTREGKAPVRKLIRCGRDRMDVAIDLRVYGKVIGSPHPPSRRRIGRLIDAARRFRTRIRSRQLLGASRRSAARVIVFGDIERLAWEERRRAAELWVRLEESARGVRLLNHPARVHCRYELLRALRNLGWNDFDVYRVSEGRMPERYPVFLRGEDDHAGATSPLIPDPDRLREELARRRQIGEPREGTLIVEFCDTADGDGIVRKFGAFRVGDRILPRHVFMSRHWMVKETADFGGLTPEDLLAVESDYVETNPHADELMARFELAGIEYGRIDYGLKDGRVQVWEINTNPTIFEKWHFEDPIRRPIHEAFAKRFDEALLQLER